MENARWNGSMPSVTGNLGLSPGKYKDYKVILEPDRDEPEWWAGAPSVVRDSDGVFWLACRMREGDSPRGLRGYDIRILRSEDGVHFEKVHALKREDVPIPGFERPAILMDPVTGLFKLYGCGPWEGGPWTIFKFDDVESPVQFDPSTARPVIQPCPKIDDRDVAVDEYKDPFILHAEGAYHAYTIGYMRRMERIYHFRSWDGENWEPVGSPYDSIMDLSGWHDFYVRPSCVVPLGVGYLFVYEGSNVSWYDPVYNIVTGLGFTFDLHEITDLTPDSPLLISQTPGKRLSTLRYSHWLHVDGEMWIYAEATRPNESNEIRLVRLGQ